MDSNKKKKERLLKSWKKKKKKKLMVKFPISFYQLRKKTLNVSSFAIQLFIASLRMHQVALQIIILLPLLLPLHACYLLKIANQLFKTK